MRGTAGDSGGQRGTPGHPRSLPSDRGLSPAMFPETHERRALQVGGGGAVSASSCLGASGGLVTRRARFRDVTRVGHAGPPPVSGARMADAVSSLRAWFARVAPLRGSRGPSGSRARLA